MSLVVKTGVFLVLRSHLTNCPEYNPPYNELESSGSTAKLVIVEFASKTALAC